ncbi:MULTISPECIES: MBL fold metallo-hydrolase [Campylobacter]|uniref:MBL fold metallo-hydrolase n=1 Tax=Campylobacter TaxID=194 RepID=UPI001EB178E6|nr:MBL fold metallo-hydrolase [Campylobacter sp. W0014]
MQITQQACGPYMTNCYILSTQKGEIIIDPGFEALKFIKEHVKNPLAILNTHGHCDHVWDNAKVKREYNIPIYIHKNDEFMLDDPMDRGFEPSKADFLVEDENILNICGTDFKFHFLPGHTPGCTMIELVGQNLMFSGDFLFYRSIGRWDFPFSDPKLMKESLQRVLAYENDYRLLPGHGKETTLKDEQAHIPSWLRYF